MKRKKGFWLPRYPLNSEWTLLGRFILGNGTLHAWCLSGAVSHLQTASPTLSVSTGDSMEAISTLANGRSAVFPPQASHITSGEDRTASASADTRIQPKLQCGNGGLRHTLTRQEVSDYEYANQ